MTASRIIELANEIAADVLRNVEHFAIDGIAAVEDMLVITYRWTDHVEVDPTIAVIIRPADHDVDESVRTEIRRQLRSAWFQVNIRVES
jgi:hypothetical protein